MRGQYLPHTKIYFSYKLWFNCLECLSFLTICLGYRMICLLTEIWWIPARLRQSMGIEKLYTINKKACNLFICKLYKIKFEYEWKNDHKIFFYCNVWLEKVMWVPHYIYLYVYVYTCIIIYEFYVYKFRILFRHHW